MIDAALPAADPAEGARARWVLGDAWGQPVSEANPPCSRAQGGDQGGAPAADGGPEQREHVVSDTTGPEGKAEGSRKGKPEEAGRRSEARPPGKRLFVGARVSVATANALAGAAQTLARRARTRGSICAGSRRRATT